MFRFALFCEYLQSIKSSRNRTYLLCRAWSWEFLIKSAIPKCSQCDKSLTFRIVVCCTIIIWLWASYQIRKIAGCACAGNAANVFPRRRFQRKSLVSDPGMHHGTCVTHVPWCMSGSRTCGDGENVLGACALAILRIWQEAHCSS